MELFELIRYGTPVLILGMLLILERINGKVDSIRETVHDIRHGMVWRETCDACHREVDRRLESLEKS